MISNNSLPIFIEHRPVPVVSEIISNKTLVVQVVFAHVNPSTTAQSITPRIFRKIGSAFI